MFFFGRPRRIVIAIVATALVLPACTTAQLQKKYTSFDTCFREQKVIATAGGAILGALIGGAVGGQRRNDGIVVAGAILGGVIGNRVAWQSCLEAFPIQSTTTVISAPPDLRPAPTQVGVIAHASTPGLNIQNVSTTPVTFGRDIEVTAVYSFTSARSGAKDIKARVSRNLLFTGPDGTPHEIASSSEDVIQQGVSRTSFAVPTPSLQDAPELNSTKNWAFKFVVEAEGLRQEQIVPLAVPLLNAGGAQSAPATNTPPALSPSTSSAPAPEQMPATITIQAGTFMLYAPNSTRIILKAPRSAVARVLQQTIVAGFTWYRVRLPDNREGWVKGPKS